jgi:hypothetical protein
MKQLPKEKRLRRGTAVLLTEQDKIDFKADGPRAGGFPVGAVALDGVTGTAHLA